MYLRKLDWVRPESKVVWFFSITGPHPAGLTHLAHLGKGPILVFYTIELEASKSYHLAVIYVCSSLTLQY